LIARTVKDGNDLGHIAAEAVVDAIRRHKTAADLFAEETSEFTVGSAEIGMSGDALEYFFERIEDTVS